MQPRNISRFSLAVSLCVLVGFGQITPLFAEPPNQATPLNTTSPLFSQPHKLTVPQAIEIAKDSLTKTNFFNVLDYQEGSTVYVDGLYAKLSIKDHSRLMGNLDQSHLYRVRVDVKPQGDTVSFVISAKNEDALGGGYAQVAKAKFEEEFNKRLSFLDKFQAQDPVVVAKRYLAAESMVQDYSFPTLKLMDLDYEPADTFENYLNTLRFLDHTCPDKAECKTLQDDIMKKDTFWSMLGVEAKKNPVILDELGKWLKPDHPKYADYVSLLNDSTAFASNSLDKLNDSKFENDNLPKEWKAKGVGTEKARAIEQQIAFKNYEYFKRSNALDVDTEEVLRVRRIGEKVFPYTLRKGLDYKIHIYDDTLGRKGTGAKINAFTSGGGILYISRSLIQRIDPQDEAAIAAVIAHELGHNEAYHIQRQVMRNNVAEVIFQLSRVGNVFVPGVAAATQLTEILVLKGFSRADELEADRLGLYVLYKAGYEPEAMGRVMKILSQVTGERFTSLMDTHPAPPARLKRIEYLIKHRDLIEKTNPGNAGDEFSDS